MKKKEYPYLNHLLKDMKGEIWEDIRGLEMYFQVSNFGRIKRLEYEMEYSDGRRYVKPSIIIKPVLMKIPNQFIKDNIYYLLTRVTLFKQNYYYSLARLVYYVYVKPFDQNDKNLVILCKNGDGRDIRSSNLQLANLHDKQKRIFDLNRHDVLFRRGKAWRNGIEKARIKNSKQVSKYTILGKKITTYQSIAVAAKETGISHCHISNRARGIEFTAGGFIWKLGDEEQIDISPMLKKIIKRRQKNKMQFGKKLTKYDMNGNRIAIYPTINDAAKDTGLNKSNISAALQENRYSAGGFYWKEGACLSKISLKGYEYGDALRAKKRQRIIKQYTPVGKFLQNFASIKEAAEKAGVHSTTIIGALTGKRLTAGGYKWKYAGRK